VGARGAYAIRASCKRECDLELLKAGEKETSMLIEWVALFLALGAFTGFFAGLLGIGGGAVMVPALVAIFSGQGFTANTMHLALGTSMAAILFTSCASVRSHAGYGAVRWPIVFRMMPGMLLGAAAGTWLVKRIAARELAIAFTVFILYVAVQMVRGTKPKPGRELPGTPGLLAIGGGIGAFSSLVAIGGGSLSVPFMLWCNVQAREAIGTSAAMGIPIALGGALGYIINGHGVDALPPYSVGFVYMPAVFMLVVASMLTAPLGAGLAHRLPVIKLRRIFAALLVVLAGKMLWTLL
jgi:uncharacterized membrane protein YfcA